MGAIDNAGVDIRRAGRSALADALRAARADTLATFAAYARALGSAGFVVPRHAQFNPPLWELGHIGWFQAHWIGRNPQRLRGLAADPDVARLPDPRGDVDALYNSSRVAHDTRWTLPLPDAAQTQADLARQLAQTLALLADTPEDDAGLYFHRLALLHEDMHHEAALYMAQALDIAIDDPRWQPRALPPPRAPLRLAPGRWRLGSAGAGFAFDNELPAHEVALAACEIDAQVRRWRDVLTFVDDGGYREPRWWTDAGRAWLRATGAQAPRYLRRAGAGWQQRRWGRWQALDPDEPAGHLCLHEAEAWCAWAGRALPSEAQWECAAVAHADAFAWGEVWEWTASPFEPYPGFVAHPYRDYSAPWFGTRRVLRGAAWATQPRLRHARYRNYFTAERNDIVAGFRSCRA